MRIAVAQISCLLGDVEANVRKIRAFAKAAKEGGADFVVFPEMADTGYAMRVIHAQAAPWTTGAVPKLQEVAKSLAIALVCGVSERDANHIYNSQAVIDGEGNVAAAYRKTHLFGPAPIEEHKYFSPGAGLTDFDADDLRFGLSICYDLRFPELYRKLAVENDVNVFIISSAWPFPRIEHFRTLCAARAIENQSYVVAANRVGTDDGLTFCGSSAVIDPYGVTVAAASADREELIFADLSAETIKSVRSRIPIFADRRRDLYG